MTGDRVGAGRLALLVLAVVAGDGAVGGFGFHGLAVGGHQHRGHQAERAKALRDLIRLHVAVIVLAGPDELARPLERRGDHVVDQAVFVNDPGGVELFLEAFGLEHFLEQILEAAVIGLEDGVLGRQVHRPAQVEAIVELARAKSRIESSRLYIASATPGEGNWNTSSSILLPSSPSQTSRSLPGPGTRKSVALY